jgi:transcriptional regulator with XRE-family HTH domain
MLSISATVISVLREMRQEQGVSAQHLADRMTELGYTVQRTVLANLESGRRKEVSVDHLVTATEALNTDLLSVLVRCQLVACPACKSSPPEGFTCNTCGAAS